MDEQLPARFESVERANALWTESLRGRRISVRRDRFIAPGARLFAMGSCFAVELRIRLRALGYDVHPKYLELAFDPETQSPGRLPRRDNINHYDTGSIRQELDRALDGRRYERSDFWKLERHPILAKRRWREAWQDPYRRDIYASSLDALAELSDRIGRCIDDGLARAEVVILTLGVNESWRNRANGLQVCMGPASEEDEIRDRVDFHAPTFEENRANLRHVLDRFKERWPRKRVVLTVSPVAHARTWTGEDVVVANRHSKSVLRAVAGELCRERPELVYWPSFEFATAEDVFKEDGRHVRDEAVDRIVGAFLAAHGTGGGAARS